MSLGNTHARTSWQHGWRWRVALGALLALSLGCGGADPETTTEDSELGAPVQARSADAFVESVGVATHLSWVQSIYQRRYADVKAAMAELGVRYYRTDSGPAAITSMRDLHESHGIRGVLVIASYDNGYHSPLSRGTAAREIGSLMSGSTAGLYAVEGPNEHDQAMRPSWAQEVRAYQAEIHAAVRAQPSLRHVLVAGPSLAYLERANESRLLGDLRAITDVGNQHHYVYWGGAPETRMHDEAQLLRTNNYGQVPMLLTETGVCTKVSASDMCVTERVQAKYIVRRHLEAFRDNPNNKSFVYEFIDQGTTQGNAAWDWGIVRADMSRKPAFRALKATIDLLKDPGPAFAPGSLAYSLSGANAETRQVLMQKRDGRFFLAVWQAARSFDGKADRELNVPPVRATLSVAGRRPLRVFRPGTGGATPIETATGSSLVLEIPDEVLLVEIGGELRGESRTHLVEAGGDSVFVDPAGRRWAGDYGFRGGSTVDRGAIAIANTNSPRLYQTERYRLTGYTLPVPSGTYTVKLHFAETYGTTDRVFDVDVEGRALNNLNVFAETGGVNRALVKTFAGVRVTDGNLDVRFTPVGNSVPMVNAVEVSPE